MDKEINFYKLDELNDNFDFGLYLYNLNMEYEFKKNAAKILKHYNTAQPNIELSKNINEIALKLFKDKRYKNPFITIQNIFINREFNLFLNTIVKYSYYALKPVIKIDKIKVVLEK